MDLFYCELQCPVSPLSSEVLRIYVLQSQKGLARYYLVISYYDYFEKVLSFRELLFLHKNNTMAILLKIASVRVSSIQIMQVRVQNKGKSVWKRRYDGDVSTP